SDPDYPAARSCIEACNRALAKAPGSEAKMALWYSAFKSVLAESAPVKLKRPPGCVTAFCFLFFMVSMGFTVYMYCDLTAWEASGGTRRVHSLVALGYNIGGKWGAVAMMGFGSLFMLYVALCCVFPKLWSGKQEIEERQETLK